MRCMTDGSADLGMIGRMTLYESKTSSHVQTGLAECAMTPRVPRAYRIRLPLVNRKTGKLANLGEKRDLHTFYWSRTTPKVWAKRVQSLNLAIV